MSIDERQKGNIENVLARFKEARVIRHRAKRLRLKVRKTFRLAVDREMAADQFQVELEKKIANVEARLKESKKAVKAFNKKNASGPDFRHAALRLKELDQAIETLEKENAYLSRTAEGGK